eukprot:1545850-Alexandrium_andersonii.AAC.1
MPYGRRGPRGAPRGARRLPLDPLLKRQNYGADQPLKLPHCILYGAIRSRPVRGRRPEHSLRAQPLCNSPAQVDQRGLVVGLEQDPAAVSEPADARHRLVHGVVAQPPFARHRARQDRPGVTVLDGEEGRQGRAAAVPCEDA